MRSVTGLCVVMGSVLGGFAPSLWGGSGLSLAAVLTTALGGAAGLWVGLRIQAQARRLRRILGGTGPLAQLVEQGTFNPKVAGSNPARPTTGTRWKRRVSCL